MSDGVTSRVTGKLDKLLIHCKICPSNTKIIGF